MLKLTEHSLDAAQRRRVSPFYTANGGDRIDTAQMLASGALEGPYRSPRPACKPSVLRALFAFLLSPSPRSNQR